MLVRVYNQMKNLECYVPAIVEFLPEDQRHPHKFYSVLMFNGQRVYFFYYQEFDWTLILQIFVLSSTYCICCILSIALQNIYSGSKHYEP